MADPFTTVMDAIMNAILVNLPVDIEITVGNVEEGDQVKTLIRSADTGGLHIKPYFGGGLNPVADSHSTRVVQNYVVGMITDNVDPRAMYFPVKWGVVRALTKAISSRGSNTGVFDVPYLTDVKVTDVMDQDDNDELQRGQLGWVGLIVVSAFMTFNRQDLIAGLV